MKRVLWVLAWMMSVIANAQPRLDIDRETGLWGYKDTADMWVVSPVYRAATHFIDGYALVTGTEVKYVRNDGSVFPEGFRVQNSRAWFPQFIIRSNGEVSCSLPVGYQADRGAVPALGLLPVRNPEGLYGYIDMSGQLVIPFRFRHAYSFGDGVAAVQVKDEEVDSLYFILNDTLQDQFDSQLRVWRRDHAALANGAYPFGGLTTVFIDSSGKVGSVLPVQYHPPLNEEGTFIFSQQLLPVYDILRERMGMIDMESFDVVLPFLYWQVEIASENRVYAAPALSGAGLGVEAFEGFMDLTGSAIFNSRLFAEPGCRYHIESLPMKGGEAWILMYPVSLNECPNRKFIKVSAQGDILAYLELSAVWP